MLIMTFMTYCERASNTFKNGLLYRVESLYYSVEYTLYTIYTHISLYSIYTII